jgi:superfamily II DNA/RNA helicase
VPLASSAYQKSIDGADPILENRALLSAIAAYVNDSLDLQFEEPSKNQAVQQKIEVRLHKRQDLAQHVTSAAAITASFGSPIAEMISSTKEIYDARFGSGFSFSDLTANTVGIKLARLMTETPTRALAMQLRLSEVKSELDYMPSVGSNNDGIREEKFIDIYRGRDGKQYLQKISEINDLIDSLALFAEL